MNAPSHPRHQPMAGLSPSVGKWLKQPLPSGFGVFCVFGWRMDVLPLACASRKFQAQQPVADGGWLGVQCRHSGFSFRHSPPLWRASFLTFAKNYTKTPPNHHCPARAKEATLSDEFNCELSHFHVLHFHV
jgi:hypothetical protein